MITNSSSYHLHYHVVLIYTKYSWLDKCVNLKKICTHTHAHTYKHTQIQTPTCKHTHTHTHMHIHTHIHTLTHTHTHTHSHTHTYTHSHTHTHTHTERNLLQCEICTSVPNDIWLTTLTCSEILRECTKAPLSFMSSITKSPEAKATTNMLMRLWYWTAVTDTLCFPR